MVRFPILLVMLTILSGIVVAQTGGMGGFGGAGNPPVTDSAFNAATGTGWRPWLSANGNYVRTLSQSQGYLGQPAYAGLAGGIGGIKQWSKKQVAGSYSAAIQYNPNTSPTLSKVRPSQAGNLSYAQQVSARMNFSLQQMGGITYGGFGFASGYGLNGVPGVSSSYGAGSAIAGSAAGSAAFGDPAINGMVDNEIFSGKVKYYGASGGVNYLISQRLSVSGFAGSSFVRRDQGIQSMNAYNVGGRLNYMLNSRDSTGAGSTFYSSTYPGFFGSARGMSYFGTYSHQFSTTTVISAQAGVANMTSEFVGEVALPPEVAAIIGSGVSLEVTRTNFWSPTFGLSLAKHFEVGSLSVSAGRGLSSGNGVVMAGMRDIASIGFGRPLSPKIGANLTAGYARASGRVGVQAITETAQAAASLSYLLIGGFGLSGQAGLRYVGVPGQSRRSDVFVGGGINWSPGSLPFVF